MSAPSSQPPVVNPITGVIVGESIVESTRALSDVASIFLDRRSAEAMDPATPVYTTFSLPETGLPELLFSTTIIQPGSVGDEFFMTRGHFHTNPERGEFNVTLRGQGAMILMDRARQMRWEPMTPGSIHNLDGRWAHRVANTGDEPLVFLCAWMSDCGHDYETIARDGFAARLFRSPSGPALR
jgi:glucose-6-phosphate isomerase